MKQYIRTEMIMASPAVRLDDGKGNVRVELLSSNPHAFARRYRGYGV